MCCRTMVVDGIDLKALSGKIVMFPLNPAGTLHYSINDVVLFLFSFYRLA